jgi:hypothetical protein
MFMLFVFFSFSKRKKILQNDIILSEVEKYENGVIPSKQCGPVMLITSHFRKSNKVFILSIDPTEAHGTTHFSSHQSQYYYCLLKYLVFTRRKKY